MKDVLILVIGCGAVLAWVWWDITRHSRGLQTPMETGGLPAESPAMPVTTDAPPQQPPHSNEQFLHAVRLQSCYPVLRGAHGYLTYWVVISTGILWIVLLANSADAAAAAYATITCGAVIVALLIEYGLFRLIVDAVDVLIDTGRRAAGQQGDAGG